MGKSDFGKLISAKNMYQQLETGPKVIVKGNKKKTSKRKVKRLDQKPHENGTEEIYDNVKLKCIKNLKVTNHDKIKIQSHESKNVKTPDSTNVKTNEDGNQVQTPFSFYNIIQTKPEDSSCKKSSTDNGNIFSKKIKTSEHGNQVQTSSSGSNIIMKKPELSSCETAGNNSYSEEIIIDASPSSLISEEMVGKTNMVKKNKFRLKEKKKTFKKKKANRGQQNLTGNDQSEEALDCLENVKPVTGESIDAVNCIDSRDLGEEAFQWLIQPYRPVDFMGSFWEQKPLHIKRENPSYYKGLFSTLDLDKILHEKSVIFTKNLDITSYSDGKRETHNPDGRAYPSVVWDFYNNGCSIRMLNPQTFHRPVWKLLASMQEHFNSFCGANMYLTPPETQGFAPHWDDIEAFVLQLEGKKRWRVYKPRTLAERLPRFSSANLTIEEIGKPILDVVLEAGDMLYFPRGYIHQGHTLEDEHSMHITISTYQDNSWGMFLEKLLPQALAVAMEEDVSFRAGLPVDYLNYMGIANMDTNDERRGIFMKKVEFLLKKLLKHAPLDSAADQLGKKYIHDSLPPFLNNDDGTCSAFGGGERWSQTKSCVTNRVELEPNTHIRLIRGNFLRVILEEGVVKVYHNLENSREYHQVEEQFIEISPDHAPAVEALIRAYPSYLLIENLPLYTPEEQMLLATGLWERGLIVTDQPLESQYDD